MLESFFNLVAGTASCQGCNLKETSTQMFSCKYYEVFEDSYFEEHLQTTASVLNGFFRIAIFREAIFQNSLSINLFL